MEIVNGLLIAVLVVAVLILVVLIAIARIIVTVYRSWSLLFLSWTENKH